MDIERIKEGNNKEIIIVKNDNTKLILINMVFIVLFTLIINYIYFMLY